MIDLDQVLSIEGETVDDFIKKANTFLEENPNYRLIGSYPVPSENSHQKYVGIFSQNSPDSSSKQIPTHLKDIYNYLKNPLYVPLVPENHSNPNLVLQNLTPEEVKKADRNSYLELANKYGPKEAIKSLGLNDSELDDLFRN